MAFPGVTLYTGADAENYTTNSFTTILDRVSNRPKFGQIDAFSMVSAASELSGDGLQGISDLIAGGWSELGKLVGMDDDTLEFLSRYVENDDGELVENGKMPWRNAKEDLSGNPWNEAFIPGGVVDYKGLADGFLSTLLGGYILKLFGPTIFRGGLSLFGNISTSMFRRGVKRDLAAIKDMRDLQSNEIPSESYNYNSPVIQTDSIPELLLAITEAFFYDNRARLAPALAKMRARTELPD